MSHITKEEYLSALLDGESGSFEQQRLCDQLEGDELMREKLSNFALIGEAVRNQQQSKATLAGESFLSGIQAAIADTPLPSVEPEAEEPVVIPAPNVAKRGIFPKQAVGYAVAASVAAVAAISIQNYFTPQSAPEMVASAPQPVQEAQPPAALMTASLTESSVSQKVISDTLDYSLPDPETRGMMNKYVAHHLQYASSNTLMPSVRAVSFSSDF